jgi:ferrous iron transport protein B
MAKKRVALVGMPNTGKSTLFNQLTGSSARIGNWPGLTVELMSARLLVGGDMVELIDLPGLHNLHGFSEDERVARHFLESQPVNAIIVVLNAAQLDRQLAFALQMRALKVPILLVLNMADEAKKRGIRIEVEKLEARLELPVCLLSAKYGQGVPEVRNALATLLGRHPESHQAPEYLLAEDYSIEKDVDNLLTQAVHVPPEMAPSHTDRIDRLLLHPWLGLPLFFLLMLGMFQLVYGLGVPLQEGLAWLLESLKTTAIEPYTLDLPAWLKSLILDGLFDGVGTVLSFLPLIVVFFLAMAVVEDSGYLARAAYLMDALMARMGLDGRAFVMQLMGFGCNVPAIMGTRVIRSRPQRLLAMLAIPFSLCSARLQVFLFFIAAVFSPRSAPWVLFSLYLMSFNIAFFSAWLWGTKARRDPDPLIMELPPYRLPTLSFLLRQSMRESGHFVRSAGGFIVLGVALVWLLTHMPQGVTPASNESWAGQIATVMAPLFDPIGVDKLLSIALLFGFVAKEVVIGSLAVIYGAGPNDLPGLVARQLDWVQAYSFMLFTLIYTPCLSTLAVMRKESGSTRFMLLSLLWSLALAWAVSFAFYKGARLLGY